MSSASDTAGAISGAIGDAMRADRNFSAAVRGLVVTSPNLSNRSLAAWLSAADTHQRYPGSAGFAFVEPVAAAQLPAFIATIESDPPAGMTPTPYVVYPPGQRAQYCLMRYGVEFLQSHMPIGTDLCALTPKRFSRAASTGTSIFTTFQAILEQGSIPKAFAGAIRRSLAAGFVIISPVYRGGKTPSTTQARSTALEGWMVDTFSIRGLLQAGIGGTSHVRVALRYRNIGNGGAWQSIGSAGAASGPSLTVVRKIRVGPGLNVRIVAAVSSSVSANSGLAGLLIALAGSMISILVFGFLIYLAASRRRAFRLVEQRTGELRHQALHDALTDLPNRALLFDRAQHMLLRARREPTGMGALFIDLDNFKTINDTFGHQAGDQLLQAVGERIRTTLRANDTVGRLGGDEFLVLVEGDSPDAGPERVAERLLTVLNEPYLLETPEQVVVSVQASIGVAVGMRESADELIRDADVALYSAKGAGKGRVVVYDPEMQSAGDDRLELETDLRRALGQGQLFVLYQPIVDLRTTTVKAAEALVRWRHPTRGVLAPDTFIPLAEATGLIVPIGRFVLDEACRQAARWRAEGNDIAISVNLSPRQLDGEHLVDDVRQTLERHGFPGASLTLELTESTFIADTDATVRILASLRELGVRISVDDFGTGYSSLSYLSTLPVDTLKIDRSFIARLGDGAASAPLVHSVIELGRALGVETVAEGIEDPSQLAWLQAQRCDSGQGYLLGRPVPPEEIDTLLEGQRTGRDHGNGRETARHRNATRVPSHPLGQR